jgi:RNA polymerase sigma factor (sigma-70 family)
MQQVTVLRSLTKRMCSGSEDAFREFHAGWFERLFRYAFVLMRGDEHAARDVVQETLLRVVRHIRAFDKEEDLWSWLTCLARSAAADQGRRVSRYRRLLEKFAGETRPMDEPQAAPDFNEALQRGLDHIGEDERTLLRRKYDEGASVRQLADDAGVSESAIESRLSRARRELRTIVFRLTGHEKE